MVHTLPRTSNYLQRVEVFPVNLEKGTINVNIVFGKDWQVTERVRFVLTFDDNVTTQEYSSQSTINDNTVKLDQVVVPNPTPWSPSSPNLHTLEVRWVDETYTQTLDAITVLMTFYWSFFYVLSFYITFFFFYMLEQKGSIWSSDNWKTLGPQNKYHATDFEWRDIQMERIQSPSHDVTLLVNAGVNYIRGAHYPQDQRFLDLCDENGIMIWSETLGPKVSVENLTNPYFLKYQVQAVNEMIDSAINNPSVVLWAFYNEGPSNNPEACPGYNVSASAIRQRDTTRYVTWANNKLLQDVCLSNIGDIISFNSYPGWYEQLFNLSYVVEFWSNISYFAQLQWPGKPFLISESGASGIYEYRNTTPVEWSQMYHEQVVEAEITTMFVSPYISGMTMWQFADIKANDQDTALCGRCDYIPNSNNCSYIDINCKRPGGENHKGGVDFWRRPKRAYQVLKQLYKWWHF
ncbi:Beta-galactosidase [Reticulomyxa filosa]|uniref:Beta-galactosidase n=1 Tax=Reticulomyxa filosa TaxID=46433 RepID=X6LGH7_RETFI|nr:Beta-galactosidase [Reticulomyxa filosa]|eukprot:ETO00451.1 Beta-galactosidase [Reticulomyxa filosa]